MSEHRTDEQIDALLKEVGEREAKATPGPWEIWGGGGYVSIGIDEPCEIVEKIPGASYGSGWNQNSSNYNFLAHSRSDIPALLSVIAQLRQQRDEAVAKCERIATGKDFYVRKTADLKRCIESHECNPSPLPAAPERTTR